MQRIMSDRSRRVRGAGISAGLAVEMRALGISDPVLVVAGRSTVAALAPAWAESMAAAGWQHRVRVCPCAGTAAEVDALAAEARSLGGRVIVGVGGTACLAAAQAAAAAIGIPFVACPTDDAAEAWASGIVSGADAARSTGRRPDLVVVDTGRDQG